MHAWPTTAATCARSPPSFELNLRELAPAAPPSELCCACGGASGCASLWLFGVKCPDEQLEVFHEPVSPSLHLAPHHVPPVPHHHIRASLAVIAVARLEVCRAVSNHDHCGVAVAAVEGADVFDGALLPSCRCRPRLGIEGAERAVRVEAQLVGVDLVRLDGQLRGQRQDHLFEAPRDQIHLRASGMEEGDQLFHMWRECKRAFHVHILHLLLCRPHNV
mmetsp:Transcript_60671/g.142882  ORF Transcript_60671/g.142882 Transcript_60671/m.142882 type:complete len:219 (-) Transcript_60671:412-1068(-)